MGPGQNHDCYVKVPKLRQSIVDTYFKFFNQSKEEESEPEKINQFKCEFCEKSFERSHHLKQHIKGVHEGVKDHKCEICGSRFGSSSYLNIHIK